LSEEKYIMWFYQKRAMIKTSEVSIPFFQCLTIFVTMETKVVLNATTPLPAVGPGGGEGERKDGGVVMG
jgi:hypothetical protein